MGDRLSSFASGMGALREAGGVAARAAAGSARSAADRVSSNPDFQNVVSEFKTPGSSGSRGAYDIAETLKDAGSDTLNALGVAFSTAANAGNTPEPTGTGAGPYDGLYRPGGGRESRKPISENRYRRLHAPYAEGLQAQRDQQAQESRDKKRNDAREAKRAEKHGPDLKPERDRKENERHAQERKQRAEGAAKGKAGLESVLDNPDAPASEADAGYVPTNIGGVAGVLGVTPEQKAQREADKAAGVTEAPPQYTGTNSYNPPQVPGAPFNQDAAAPRVPFNQDDAVPPEGDSGTSGTADKPSSPAAPAAKPAAAATKKPVPPKPKSGSKASPKTKKDEAKKPSKGPKKGLPKGKLEATLGKYRLDPVLDADENGEIDKPPQDA